MASSKTSPSSASLSTVPPSSTRRTYVLDTSVLLADPAATKRFAEHEVVLPVVVITELEGKRNHPELGFFARSALRALDELRVVNGRLDQPVPVGTEGGTVRVELNHTDPESLPSGFRLGDNDTRILAVARNLANEGHRVTLVSKDLPLRIKASAVGLDAEEYRAEAISSSDTGYTGMAELEVLASDLDELYEDGVIDLAEARDLPCHNGLVLLSDRGTALGRVGADKRVHLVRGDRDAFGIHGRSAEQRVALEMLLDPEVGIVSLGALVSRDVVDEVMDRGMLEVLPLTHIRGRSLHDAFVIVDEAQSLERNVLLTVLSRIGQNSRVVLTHDVAQRDNLRVGRHDGIASVIETLKGHPLFGHITLTRSERSAIAALVTEMLESNELA